MHLFADIREDQLKSLRLRHTWMYKCRQRQDAGSDQEVGEGREQAVPARPAPSAFAHPCTADAETHALARALPLIFLQDKGFTIHGIITMSVIICRWRT